MIREYMQEGDCDDLFIFRPPNLYFYCILLQHGKPALYNLAPITGGNYAELKAFYFKNGYLPGSGEPMGLQEVQRRLGVENPV